MIWQCIKRIALIFIYDENRKISQDILRSGNKLSEQCIILFSVCKQIHGIYLHIYTHKLIVNISGEHLNEGIGVRGEGCLTFAL